MEDSRIMDRGAASGTSEETPDGMTLVQAFVPYILLTVVTMVVLVVPPVNRFLNQVSIGFSFPETSTGYGFVNQATELFFAVAALYPCQYVLCFCHPLQGWCISAGTDGFVREA